MERYLECRQRLSRAFQHGKTFVELANTFFGRNPPALTFHLEHDGASGGVGYAIANLPSPVDPALALEIGEFFYQLRASLDGAVWAAATEVCRPNDPPAPNRLDFPIKLTENEFRSSVFWQLPLPPDLRAFVEAIQPYHLGQGTRDAEDEKFMEGLRVLHDCARFDRHRQLHVFGGIPLKAEGRFTCIPPTSVSSIQPLHADFLQKDCQFIRFGIEGWDGLTDPEIHLEGHLDIQISVKEIPVPLGGDYAEYLTMMARGVSMIISKFAEYVP